MNGPEDRVLLVIKRHRLARWWKAVRLASTSLGEGEAALKVELRQLMVALKAGAEAPGEREQE